MLYDMHVSVLAVLSYITFDDMLNIVFNYLIVSFVSGFLLAYTEFMYKFELNALSSRN